MRIEAATNFYKIAILMEHIQLFQNIVVQIETLSGNMEAGEGKKSCTISWVFILDGFPEQEIDGFPENK